MRDDVTTQETQWRTTDRLLYNPDLEWLLCSSASACGERGTLAGVIGAIERGCAAAGSSYEHPYTDLQLGLGKYHHGDVQRARELGAIWALVALMHQRTLSAYYSTAGARAVHLFGALAQFAGVALLLAVDAGDAGSLIQAPQAMGKQAKKLLATYRELARERTRAAHREWLDAKRRVRDGAVRPEVTQPELDLEALRKWSTRLTEERDHVEGPLRIEAP